LVRDVSRRIVVVINSTCSSSSSSSSNSSQSRMSCVTEGGVLTSTSLGYWTVMLWWTFICLAAEFCRY